MPEIGWIMFLLSGWMLGYSICVCLAVSGLHWMPFSEQGQMTAPMLATGGLRFVIRQIISFWIGMLLLTSGHYALSWLLLTLSGPVTAGVPTQNLTAIIVILLAFLAAALLRRNRRLSVQDDYRLPRRQHLLFKRYVLTGAAGIWILFVVIYAVWLFYSTFYQAGGMYHAGATVHSDLGPHTALMSSFANGQNIPTEYPHFAGDGIRYHFFFYYFAAILNQLGLGFVTALNLPSILAFISMLGLIGLLAYRITGRAGTAVLAPVLTIFRSSWAWLTDIWQKAGEHGWFSADFFRAVWTQRDFIGSTPRDSWGLWSINVYANQRHLALGISLLLIILLLALPDIERGVGALPRDKERKFPVWWAMTKKRQIWLQAGLPDKKRHLLMAIILVFMPFWHGAMTLAALLILFPMAVFTASRLTYVALAGLTTASALLTSRLFAPADSALSSFALEFGFIAENKTIGGMLLYLAEMLGPLLIVIIVSFAVARWRTRLYLLSATIPLVFALFVRLTPDVTVNHKFIQITIILWNVVAAESLIRLYGARKKAGAAKALAVATALLIMATGLYEHKIFHNINSQIQLTINPASDVNRWVMAETDPNDIFLTGPYAYHSFFLTGRPVWYGHPYYAWSAGHDTGTRETDLENLLQSSDPDAFARYAAENGIAYLLVDRAMRERYPDMDEARLVSHLLLEKRFGDADGTVIYRLKDVNP